MDLSPRDRRLAIRADRIRRLLCRHASCKVRTVWEHSPTRKEIWDKTHINRGAPLYYQLRYCPPPPPPPQLLPGPTILVGPPRAILTCHVVPLTGVRVASCHTLAPPTPCAGHPGSATWPQCRVAPRGGPVRHVSCRSPRHPAGK